MRMPSAADAHVPRPLPPAAHVLGCIALLVGAGLMDLFLLNQQQGMSMSAGLHNNDLGQWIIWLLACRLVPVIAACAGALILWRMSRSAARQYTQTQGVLRPLLAQAPLAPPAHLKRLLQSLQLAKRTRLIACEVPIALCYGLLRPRLLFSTSVFSRLSPLEAEAIVRHEQAHLRRHDPLRRLLLRALADALALQTPRDIAEALPLLQELTADRAVLAAVGPTALSGALLKVGDTLATLEQRPAGPRPSSQPLAAGAFSVIDARMDQLLGVPAARHLGRAICMLLGILLILLVSGPLLCLLLPFPAPLIWLSGVLLTAGWERLHTPSPLEEEP